MGVVVLDNHLRLEIAARCCSRRTRLSAFSREAPTDWNPNALRHPDREEYFTEDSAWEFIAKHLRDGCPIELIALDKPIGKKGYVLLLQGHPPVEIIYVKLQLGADNVLGRSFHQSYLQKVK